MFTGIVASTGTVNEIHSSNSLKLFTIKFKDDFCAGLEIGGSVSIDGVCLTVTELLSNDIAKFDAISQSLKITTLDALQEGSIVNAERAAKDGAEIGGHVLSGHIDFQAEVIEAQKLEGNFRLRISASKHWMKYIFPKGYIALNGASLTISDVCKPEQWFEVWLIPETRRATTMGSITVGDFLNVEIERGTQVVVDTVIENIEKQFVSLYPAIEKILESHGIDLQVLATPLSSNSSNQYKPESETGDKTKK